MRYIPSPRSARDAEQERGSLQLPLLGRASAINARRAEVHGLIFIGGFAVYVVGAVAEGYSVGVSGSTSINKKYDRNAWSESVWTACNTVGMLVMTLADADANRYVRRNRVRLIALLVVWFASYVFAAFGPAILGAGLEIIFTVGTAGYLVTLPGFLYLGLRWRQLIEMEECYPLLTDVFSLLLALDALAYGLTFVLPSIATGIRMNVGVVVVSLLAPPAMLLAHRWSVSKQESPTIRFNTVAYAYQLFMGSAFLVMCLYARYVNGVHWPLGWWLAGPIHLVPTLLMILFRPLVQSTLGRGWLEDRGRDVGKELRRMSSYQGCLPEVEEAISGGRDLNAYHHTTGEDSYTLQLACVGNHLDAVQRLLTFGGVEVNKATEVRGWTPVFLASQLGHAHCVTMLLEYHADPNMHANDGQTPLLIASAKGHREIARMLKAAGASERREWMALTAKDVEGGERDTFTSEATAAEPDGRKRTQRPLLAGQPGYNDSALEETLDSTTSTSRSGWLGLLRRDESLMSGAEPAAGGAAGRGGREKPLRRPLPPRDSAASSSTEGEGRESL